MRPLELDHVLIAVDDLEAGAADLERRTGLASVEGGRHAAWGTANRIIPLGRTYLELIAVVEPQLAATTIVGRWVARTAALRPMGWVVRTDDIDAVGARLRLTPVSGSRVTPDGQTLTWRMAGIDEASAEPCLAFFIQWGRGVPHPGSAAAAAGGVRAAIERVVLSGDRGRLETWLGEFDLPVELRPGQAAITGVVVGHDGRDLTIGA